MAAIAMQTVLEALRATVLQSPRLAALPAHLMNEAFTETQGARWEESMELLSEEIKSLGGFGNHTEEASLEYIVTLRCDVDEGTGRIWQTANEVKTLCKPGLAVILGAGQQATVMASERLGPRKEDDDFVMRVRLDVLTYGLA